MLRKFDKQTIFMHALDLKKVITKFFNMCLALWRGIAPHKSLVQLINIYKENVIAMTSSKGIYEVHNIVCYQSTYISNKKKLRNLLFLDQEKNFLAKKRISDQEKNILELKSSFLTKKSIYWLRKKPLNINTIKAHRLIKIMEAQRI